MSRKLRKYTIKLVNDNGHLTGTGSASIQVAAHTRAIAQASALQWIRARGGPAAARRRHGGSTIRRNYHE